MRTTMLALALLWGCHSEGKLQNGQTPPPSPGTATTPNGGGGGDDDDNATTPNGGTNPSTQSTPAGDDDDTTSTGTGNGGGGDTGSTSTTSDTGLTDDAFCQKAATLAGFLDSFQTPDDGKVIFCHGAGGHYNKIDTDISACLPHLNHQNDVFPTTGCDS